MKIDRRTLIAGAVAGLLWSVIGPCVLPGVGGRLGLVAFMASTGIYWLGSVLGYDKAAEIAKTAHKHDLTLREAALRLTLRITAGTDHEALIDASETLGGLAESCARQIGRASCRERV